MKTILHPEKAAWKELLKRPYVDNRAVLESVQGILNAVREHGDEALRSFTRKYDGVELSSFEVTSNEMEEATHLLPEDLKKAIGQAKKNIEHFHALQHVPTAVIETMHGVRCWRKEVGIEKVGLYIPGGTAPLFSTVLMLAVPARLAQCREIILCTPSDKNGKIHPAILYAAAITGVTRIFKTGGAQAVAAMAYGTKTIPSVYKIFGPGNQYVTTAKLLVQMQGIAIDLPAGPSEVCVLADDTANPVFIASDLLAQAEHGPDSQVLLVSNDSSMVARVQVELETQLDLLPRKETAQKALQNSRALVVKDFKEAIDLVNEDAPEHLILCCRGAEGVSDQIFNAGSVFIGDYSPESVGDYASGTNHTLPTNGYARAYSGVSLDSFTRKITFQQLSEQGLKNISGTVISMAEAEGLQGHANAVKVRMNPETKSIL